MTGFSLSQPSPSASMLLRDVFLSHFQERKPPLFLHGSSEIPTPVSGMMERHRLPSGPRNTPEDIRVHCSSQHTLKDLKVEKARGGRGGRSSFLAVLSSQDSLEKGKD